MGKIELMKPKSIILNSLLKWINLSQINKEYKEHWHKLPISEVKERVFTIVIRKKWMATNQILRKTSYHLTQ